MKKIIVVAKKQSDKLDRLTALFRDQYPNLKTKWVQIIDDEAGYASVWFWRERGSSADINVTGAKIDQLRQLLSTPAFLQFTATPCSLYLQPEDLVVRGIEFKPIRPAFTELASVNPANVGCDYYFKSGLEGQIVASIVYRPITTTDLTVLRSQDRRR